MSMIEGLDPGDHAGTVTTKGWRRTNGVIEIRYDLSADDGGKLHLLFNWTYKRKLFGVKRVFTIIIMPRLGEGWNYKFAAFRFIAGATVINFSGQINDSEHGSATYNLSKEVVDMMDEFFAMQDDFVFELHGPDGIQLGLPLANDTTAYLDLTAGVRRALGLT